ncbi:MAG TPA: TSUP family transporter [Beijerinckiaceae bacterium]|nr:TSUP family transporter [Beijerinckiaceae bacterium]
MPDLMSLIGVSFSTLMALMAVSFCAAIVDAIAGGGGLLNVPSLMIAGLDPVSAVATNKVQGSFGVASSTLAYARAGLIRFREMAFLFLCSFVGAGAGAVAAQTLPIGALRTWIPLVLIGLALFVATAPKLTDADSHARLRPAVFAFLFAAPIGFYDGMFGPAGGTFFFIALVTMLGQGVLKAVAHTKLLNLASNLGALCLFLFSGKIYWAVGLCLGVAAFAGAQIGARAALSRGARLVKPMVVAVAVLMAIRLLLDPAHPVGQWLRGG